MAGFGNSNLFALPQSNQAAPNVMEMEMDNSGQITGRASYPTTAVGNYMTGVVNGRNQGFFHGTGHGVGLDIHELPRISRLDYELKTGHVVTVEPGLYYPGKGAVRIEDMVLVEPGGCRNLTRSPKMELLEL